ncbi:MAG: hypothetical protein V7633_2162 [Pseudonocardia sp.]|jgi:hypothetical protein
MTETSPRATATGPGSSSPSASSALFPVLLVTDLVGRFG